MQQWAVYGSKQGFGDFSLKDVSDTKDEAQKRAALLRSRGWSARIVKVGKYPGIVRKFRK